MRRPMNSDLYAQRMRERITRHKQLSKLPRAEVVSLAQRKTRVNAITERTSKSDAIYYILDCELPVW